MAGLKSMSDEELEAEHTKVGEAGVASQEVTRTKLEAIKAEQTSRVRSSRRADLEAQLAALDADTTEDLSETGEDA